MTMILGIQSTRLSDVQPERVSWMWPGRIPLGKITILDGDPDNGKSTLSLDLAARVTCGRTMPDGSYSDVDGPAGVVLLSAEDGLSDTIRPRLDASGANPELVSAITGTLGDDGYEHSFQLPDDLEFLKNEVIALDARLIIVDPLMAYLSGGTNSFRDQDIRSALAPLSRLADETGAAIVVIRHLNKSQGGSPLYRGGGSIGIIGAARSGLLAAKDPDDESRRILAVTKSNLAAPVPALAYRLEPTPNGSVRIEWEGATNHNAGQLLAGPQDDEERTARRDAMDILTEILSYGPVPAKTARKEARDAGISDRTIDRAKKDLRIIAERTGGVGDAGYWQWRLPETNNATVSDSATKAAIRSNGALRHETSINPPNFPHKNRQNTKDATGGVHRDMDTTKNTKNATPEDGGLSNKSSVRQCLNCGLELNSTNKSDYCGRLWCRKEAALRQAEVER